MAPSHQVLFSTLLLASSAFASYADDSILYQRDASGLSALDSEDYLLARAILDTNDFDLADTVHAREADPDAEPIFPIFAALPALAAKGAALGAKGAAIGAKVGAKAGGLAAKAGAKGAKIGAKVGAKAGKAGGKAGKAAGKGGKSAAKNAAKKGAKKGAKEGANRGADKAQEKRQQKKGKRDLEDPELFVEGGVFAREADADADADADAVEAYLLARSAGYSDEELFDALYA